MFVMAFIVILATASTIVELTFCPACKIIILVIKFIHLKKKKKKLIKNSYPTHAGLCMHGLYRSLLQISF
jgi:hypothetical protein